MFNTPLSEVDSAVARAIDAELARQQNSIELIASENLTSKAVMQAQGSVMTNKYAEGYPNKRYYGGCVHVDAVETLAIERVCKLFGAAYANVQPHSGSQANQAVFNAVLNPGDRILGMSLDQGGHLTHGAKVNQSGKWFESHQYGLGDGEVLDYDAIKKQALDVKPQLIIAGGSAYARLIDFTKFKDIADAVGAYLLVDMAHIAGPIAAGLHPNPVPVADFVTSTTHKTLRGPRGGVVLCNDEELIKKVNRAVFPGIQGGPLMHVIAAKAVAFGEALQPKFKQYMQRVLANTAILAEILSGYGVRIVSDKSENHLALIDLSPLGITGKDAEAILERSGITCNKNSVPNDSRSPFVTSGIRVGAAAATSRGFGVVEFTQIGHWMGALLVALANDSTDIDTLCTTTAAAVEDLCRSFPIYSEGL